MWPCIGWASKLTSSSSRSGWSGAVTRPALQRPTRPATGSTRDSTPIFAGVRPRTLKGCKRLLTVSAENASTVLLERERELAEIDGVADKAGAGRGGLVLVEGPAGIGKTRLLEAGRGRAEERGMVLLSARASELDREFPFGVIRQLFEALLAGAGAERRAALLQGAAGPAASLVGACGPGEQPAAAEADASLAHFHALYWLTANLADEAPAALFIDDVHLADASSLRFLQFLLPRLQELPVLVALASRAAEPSNSGEVLDAIAADPVTLVLRPAPLTEAAVRDLVAGALGRNPDPRFCEACGEVTGGNPFLLRELLRDLAGEDVAPTAAEAPLVRRLAPPTVARAVLVRLGRLGAEAASLARAVAVLGDSVPLRRAAALAKLPDKRAAEVATLLIRSGIFGREGPLGFAHPILRSSVYGDADPQTRSSLHRRAAELLAAEGIGADAIAVHLLATDPAGEKFVVETLREAAAGALARGASSTAVACLQRALTEPPPVADRGRLFLELGSAEVRAGDTVAASEHFIEGLRVTEDPRTRAVYAQQQVVALLALGRRDEAFALLEREVDEAAQVDAELALLIEADLIATTTFERSRVTWARQRLERYRGRLSSASAGERMLLATDAHLDAAYGERSADELADEAERALASGRLLDDTGGTSPTFFQAIDVLVLADRTGPAQWELDRAMDEARRRGSAPLFAFASGWRCWLMAREGALAEAEADGRSCAEVSLPQGWFVSVPLMLGHLLDVLVDRGELDDAAELLELSGMADRRGDEDRAFDRALSARMRLRLARGDMASARGDLAALTRVGRDVRWNTYPAYVPAALLAPGLAAADSDQAREQAERSLRQARTWGTLRGHGMALHAAALVEDEPNRLELLESACSVLEPSPARLEYAHAQIDFGAALRRANNRVDAREVLRRGLDLAHACGARPLAERARQELRAAGGRPRHSAISGVDALTPSERRIAAMAANGLSNPEIAQALFVTKKTVEAHLSNAYRKLDIHSRTELGAALKAPHSS